MEIQEILVADRGVSRRSFIKGVIAAGATVSSASYLFRSPGTAFAQAAQGTVERLVTLNVNGQARPVDVAPQETLGTTLRYKLGLTGTKYGCDRAECGACTVLIDGAPHYSCSLLTHQVRGRQVTTIEGLAAPNGTLSVVQQAVLEEAGFQCAFCSSGFIMAMTGMLNRNPNPTREEARRHLSGNLCRCGDYDKILASAMRAIELSRATA
ncbi:MAG: (2Fe-2S)-binding protein [Gemmatimonadota bacterium]|jgi:aerobic-type carbon monoxide dehydrogenase small subunit (CoxS/CutS family)